MVEFGRAARNDLEFQTLYISPMHASLSSLWRAAGSPPGREPRTWAEGLAARLIEGLRDYHAAFERACPYGSHYTLVETWTYDPDPAELGRSDDRPDWQPGDFIAEYSVAVAYAEYLDRMADEDDSYASHLERLAKQGKSPPR